MTNQKTIEVLQAEIVRIRDRAAAEVAELEQNIARLKKEDLDHNEPNQNQSFADVRTGEYANVDTRRALRVYLNARGGGPVSIERAAVDLALGGVDLGRPERHARNLKIMISNNRKDFEYADEGHTTVRLPKGAVRRGR